MMPRSSRSTAVAVSIASSLLVQGCYATTGAWRHTGDFRADDARLQTSVVQEEHRVELTRSGEEAQARLTIAQTCEDQLVGTNMVERQIATQTRQDWPAEAIVGIGGTAGFMYLVASVMGGWHQANDFRPVLVIDGAAIAMAAGYLLLSPPHRQVQRWTPVDTTVAPLPNSRHSCGTPQPVVNSTVSTLLRFPATDQELTWLSRTDSNGVARFPLARARGVVDQCGTGWLELKTADGKPISELADGDGQPLTASPALAIGSVGPRLSPTANAWAELVRRCENAHSTHPETATQGAQ